VLFPQVKLRYGSKLFLSHLLAVFLVSGSVGSYFYLKAMDNLMRSLQSRLQNSAALLSRVIDAGELEAIRTPDDISQPTYRSNLEKLRAIRRLNPDIAFLYVMRREGDRVEFVLDSDETDAQALPGKEYDEIQPRLLQGFTEPSVDEEPYRDQWGIFLSGYSPLLNGNGQYLVGIDMRADEVDNKLAELRLTGLVSLLASVLLALGLAHWLSRGLARRINTLTETCRRYALGRFDETIQERPVDEFGQLMEAFNTMGEELGRARSRSDAAMKELSAARDNLEERVRERTAELQEVLDKVKVMSGLLPICASCKKIRDDKGYWQQVEDFVGEHTGAHFSHGLCPACVSKLYAEFVPDIVSDGDRNPETGLKFEKLP